MQIKRVAKRLKQQWYFNAVIDYKQKKQPFQTVFWSGKRDSNSRPRPWQGSRPIRQKAAPFGYNQLSYFLLRGCSIK